MRHTRELDSGSPGDLSEDNRKDNSRCCPMHTYCCHTVGPDKLRRTRSRSMSHVDRLRQCILDRRPIEKSRRRPASSKCHHRVSSSTSLDNDFVTPKRNKYSCHRRGRYDDHQIRSIEEIEENFQKTLRDLDTMNNEFVSSSVFRGWDKAAACARKPRRASPETCTLRPRKKSHCCPAKSHRQKDHRSSREYREQKIAAEYHNLEDSPREKAMPDHLSIHYEEERVADPHEEAAPEPILNEDYHEQNPVEEPGAVPGAHSVHEKPQLVHDKPQLVHEKQQPEKLRPRKPSAEEHSRKHERRSLDSGVSSRHRKVFNQAELISHSRLRPPPTSHCASSTQQQQQPQQQAHPSRNFELIDGIFDNIAVVHKNECCRKLRFNEAEALKAAMLHKLDDPTKHQQPKYSNSEGATCKRGGRCE